MPTRRHFLQKITLGASVLMAQPTFENLLPEKKKLGIALVGLGNYAMRQIAPALLETEHCVLRGIVTGSPEKVPIWCEKYNIPKQNVYNYQQVKQIDTFVRNILDKTQPLASGEEGLLDMKIIEAIKLSADTGQRVKMVW